MTRTIDGATVRVPTLAEVIVMLEQVRAFIDGLGDRENAVQVAAFVGTDDAIDALKTIDGALADEAVTINRIRGQR